MIITEIEMIFISVDTPMSDFREQEVPDVFIKCDPNNMCITITCNVLKNADSPDLLIQKSQHVNKESSVFRS